MVPDFGDRHLSGVRRTGGGASATVEPSSDRDRKAHVAPSGSGPGSPLSGK